MDQDRQNNWTGERLETFVYTENTSEHLHRYAMALEFATGKKLLDIACGEGYGSALLAGVAAEVHGVDIDAATVHHAAEKYKAGNLRFVTGAADAIPYPDHMFDAVVSFETIEHHDRHEAMMQEIKRVLKPGGILIISSPDKKYYSDVPGYKNPFHIKELYKDEFEQLIGKYFRHANFFGQRFFNGSVVVALNNRGNEPEPLYSGGYEQLYEKEIQAVYCIAVASDEALPESRNSFFDGASVLKKQFAELQQAVTENVTAYVTAQVTVQATRDTEARIMRSWSYRIGHAVLKPFSALKKILHA